MRIAYEFLWNSKEKKGNMASERSEFIDSISDIFYW